jgi:LAS superfamily LD-carboxypeptidase LdcB
MLQNPMLTGGGTSPPPVAMQAAGMPTPGPTIPNDANAFPGQAGMDARLADASQDFIQDNPGTYLSSGVRSTADQARLYADRANNPNPVAVPGTSRHERGLAIDIGGMTPDQRAMLPQYGLAQPVANDPPHVELAQADPSALPVNAQAAQGFAAQQVPSIPPAMANYIRRTLSNPLTRAAGMQLLQQYSKPRETHTQMTDIHAVVEYLAMITSITRVRHLELTQDEAGGLHRLLMEAEDHAIAIRDGFRKASRDAERGRA